MMMMMMLIDFQRFGMAQMLPDRCQVQFYLLGISVMFCVGVCPPSGVLSVGHEISVIVVLPYGWPANFHDLAWVLQIYDLCYNLCLLILMWELQQLSQVSVWRCTGTPRHRGWCCWWTPRTPNPSGDRTTREWTGQTTPPWAKRSATCSWDSEGDHQVTTATVTWVKRVKEWYGITCNG